MNRLLAAGLLASTAPALAQEVKPAWSGITEELFQTYVVCDGLKALGYDVGPVNQAQIQLTHLAVAQGDLTFYAAHWIPLHDVYMEQSGGPSAIESVGKITTNSLQGYLIDKKTADATGIKYLEDLKDPEKAKLSTSTVTARRTSTAASRAGAASG